MPSGSISHYHERESSAWRSRRLAPLVAAVLAFAAYAITLGGTYVYDDVVIVHEDPRVLKPGLWYQLWTKPYFVRSVDQLYRPLVSMSFAVQNWLHGDRPWVFHLVNILLHAGAAAAVAMLGIRLGGPAVGFIAGVLFAVHPVHVEAVAGLVGRSELLCLLATLIGILIFLRSGPTNAWRITGITICFVVAVLSKEQGILFPLLLVAAEPLRDVDRRSPAERQGRLWLILILSWMLAWYLFARMAVAPLTWDRQTLDWYVNPLVRSTGADRLLMPLVILGHYLVLLVFPLHMSIDYGGLIIGWRASTRDPYLYLGMAALLIWAGATLLSWRRRHWPMLFCLLGFAICYCVIGNFLTLIGTNMADRLMYMPSAFFLLAIALLLARLPRKVLVPLVALLAVLGIARTEAYAWQWNNRIRLYRATARAEPDSERAYSLLADELEDAGDWANGRRVAEFALRKVPYRWEPYVMCMKVYMHDGDLPAAAKVIDLGLSRLQSKAERMTLLTWHDIIAKERTGDREQQ